MEVSQLHISADLVRLILLLTYNDRDASTLTACQCVNEMWYRQGQAIRWGHVFVESKNFRIFFRTLELLEYTNRSPLNLITSLTLQRTNPLPEEDLPFEDLSQVGQWLPKLPRLHTISYNGFSYSTQYYTDDTFPWLSTEILLPIKSLSFCRAIENLEIDWVKVSGTTYADDAHMCLAIRQILPNLRRLRYIRQPCCYLMFEGLDTVCPKLEEIVIDLDANDLVSHCGLGESLGSHGDRLSAMVNLTASASRVIEQGLMPNINHFVICGRSTERDYTDQMYNNHNRSEHTFTYSYKIDMLRRKTTVFPTFIGDRLDSNGMNRLRLARRYGLRESWMLFKDPKTGQTHDLIGGVGDFHALIHGRNWLQSWNKARLPAREAYRSTGLQWSEEPQLEQLIDKYKLMRSRYRVQTRLWFLQERLKRTLLEVKEFEGTLYPEMPLRERVDNDWVYFDEVNYRDRDILSRAPF